MELVLFWLVLCVAVGIAATRRYDRSGIGWFLLSVVISPFLGFILLLAFGPPKRAAH